MTRHLRAVPEPHEPEATPWAGDDDLRRALMGERFGRPDKRPETPAQKLRRRRKDGA